MIRYRQYNLGTDFSNNRLWVKKKHLQVNIELYVRLKTGRTTAGPNRSGRRARRRILHKDLKLQPYKIQVLQVVNDIDKLNSKTFSRQFLNFVNDGDGIIHNMLMSDKAHFPLRGYVMKRNFRYSATTNPREIYHKPCLVLKLLYGVV